MKSQPVRLQKIASLPPAMTPMSGSGVLKSLNIADLTGLAQRSLITLAIMALGASGCLVTDSPEFKEPRRTPPLVIDLNPSPFDLYPLENIAKASGGRAFKPLDLYFYVVSEDLQQPLHVLFLLDYKRPGFPTGRLLYQTTIPAASLDSPPRKVTCNAAFQADVLDGCHSVTALVSHEFENLEPKQKNPLDLAIATWWFMVGFDPSNPTKQLPCVPGDLPRDAGADAPEGGLW
jgi:hypothetical protein